MWADRDNKPKRAGIPEEAPKAGKTRKRDDDNESTLDENGEEEEKRNETDENKVRGREEDGEYNKILNNDPQKTKTAPNKRE